MFKFLRSPYFYLVLIIIAGFVARLYKIDSPIADWHSWRQADTAAVTRNFIKEGFNPFYPKYDDMSGVAENPIVNPARFRFVEFPIYNIATYPFYLYLGVNDKYSRLVSVLFSLGSVVLIYFITKKYTDSLTALLASLIFALLPFNVFFSRTTLPEPTFVFFALAMFYSIDLWIEKGSSRSYWVALLFAMVAFLIKPWAIFFALPLVYSAYLKEGRKLPFKVKYILFAAVALLPFLMWRLWILQQPEGIPASNWLANGDGIRLKPMFWWWLLSERLGHEILGVAGIFLFIIGFLFKPKNGNYLLHLWLLSMLLYFVIFATGNVRHNYYQVIFVPIASIFTAIGFRKLILGNNDFIPRFWGIILAFVFLPLTFYFSWVAIKGFYQVNNYPIISVGKVADRILPKNARVVAPYNGDTAFLYQINRPGFPVTILPLADMISRYDVTYYISTSKDAKTNWVIRHFNVLREEPDFIIADLTQVKKPLLDPTDPEP